MNKVLVYEIFKSLPPIIIDILLSCFGFSVVYLVVYENGAERGRLHFFLLLSVHFGPVLSCKMSRASTPIFWKGKNHFQWALKTYIKIKDFFTFKLSTATWVRKAHMLIIFWASAPVWLHYLQASHSLTLWPLSSDSSQHTPDTSTALLLPKRSQT